MSICLSIILSPLGNETTGVVGSEARNVLYELALGLKAETGERRSYHYLLQRIAVAVQKGTRHQSWGQVMTSMMISLSSNFLFTLITYYYYYYYMLTYNMSIICYYSLVNQKSEFIYNIDYNIF